MIRRLALFILLSFMLTSCVSMKKYRDTKSELLSLKYGYQTALDDMNALRDRNATLEDEYALLMEEMRNSSDDSRIAELEAMIIERDALLEQIRMELVEAVGDLEGRGLSLVNRNGKIYVLMDDKLLFESGKYDITREGKRAIRDIGKVLVKITNVDIVIEGHTDNKGLLTKTGAQIIDNWDLSCKRATEVVRLLNETKGLSPKRITASGRGQYIPVADNKTESGRAQNRRTEIVLTPKLDKLLELLK